MRKSTGQLFAMGLASLTATPAIGQTQDLTLPPEIIVTASALDLLGKADTSSEGTVTQQELQQRPAYRVGQLLESIPGLTVTAHSGEGKANQYLLRGFNLDHGTDLATFIDEMPVNQRSHAHGQGYTDLNFLIAELGTGISFSKGPYDAQEGDFGSVGADHIELANTLTPTISVSAGNLGDRRLFGGGSMAIGHGAQLLVAAELFRLDGPWEHPDRFKKFNGTLRYSRGSKTDGITVTLLAYDARWHATTDQPQRAIAQGLIGRFGSLDPSDGGASSRYSISANYMRTLGTLSVRGNAFAIRQRLTLWNNFTHYLEDPVLGDQHAQHDRRFYFGGGLAIGYSFDLGSFHNSLKAGGQMRVDRIGVDLFHTANRRLLQILRDDDVHEASVGAFAELRTTWSSWMHTVIGLRHDHFTVGDKNRVGGLTGNEGASLTQPKASIAFGPWAKTELYLSAGRGFHSNDGRAGLVELPDLSTTYLRPPLLVRSAGAEIGLRSNIIRHVTLAATLFQLDFDSELTYNADAGQTEAGRPSRRRGLEFGAQYRPVSWLELNTNVALSKARYRDGDPAGPYVEDAPSFVASAGLLVDNLGKWFGALAFRNLGGHPLTEDDRVRSAGYREINANIGYKLSPAVRVRGDVFNLLNSKQDAADYFYRTRLQGEGPDGIEGIQSHPLEPRSMRMSVTATF